MLEHTLGKNKTLSLTLTGMFAALVAVGAFIQIPVPYLDYFTLQFFFVLLAGMVLGKTYGALAVVIYLIIGIIGIPVFAAGGGPSYVLRPSFGYLIGFLAAAWVTGAVCEKVKKTYSGYLLAAFTGCAVTYLIGITYKYMILNLYLGETTSVGIVLLSCFPLDLPGDIVLCLLAAGVADKMKTFRAVS